MDECESGVLPKLERAKEDALADSAASRMSSLRQLADEMRDTTAASDAAVELHLS